jgi:maltose O-acetyltransferase
MLTGELYNAFDPELVNHREKARDLCQKLNATQEADRDLRRELLLNIFGKGGDTVSVQPPFFCDYGSNIELGEKVFFNFNCILLDVCKITVGDYCQFGSGVQILTPLHPLDAELRRKQEFGAPVTIGSDVWVGSGSLILPGVTIGPRTVVGAGSVVSRSLPSDVLAVGNPCRAIRNVR